MLISHQPRANRQGMGIAVRGCAAVLLTRVRERTRRFGRTAALLVREKLGNYGTHEVSQLFASLPIGPESIRQPVGISR